MLYTFLIIRITYSHFPPYYGLLIRRIFNAISSHILFSFFFFFFFFFFFQLFSCRYQSNSGRKAFLNHKTFLFFSMHLWQSSSLFSVLLLQEFAPFLLLILVFFRSRERDYFCVTRCGSERKMTFYSRLIPDIPYFLMALQDNVSLPSPSYSSVALSIQSSLFSSPPALNPVVVVFAFYVCTGFKMCVYAESNLPFQLSYFLSPIYFSHSSSPVSSSVSSSSILLVLLLLLRDHHVKLTCRLHVDTAKNVHFNPDFDF